MLALYLDEAISKKHYAPEKKPLDIQLEKHSEDVDTLSQELEQSTELEEHMESITQLTEAATAELSQDRKNRYVDAVFTSPDLPVKRNTLRTACQLRV